MNLSLASALHPARSAQHIEAWLEHLLPEEDRPPTLLHSAMRYAVLSGGAKRLRPRLLMAVAAAHATSSVDMDLLYRAACAIELVHGASLAHDDLPCFDDASLRRGRPTVHKLFGEAMAVLVGDALLTQAFMVLAASRQRPMQSLKILSLLGQATGSEDGVIGGQSLEQLAVPARSADVESPRSEVQWLPNLLPRYHAMKTAALFRLAAETGAIVAGGSDAGEWAEVGLNIGLVYQLLDDLYDVCERAQGASKPVGRDAALCRPNAALLEGAQETRARMLSLLNQVKSRIRQLAHDPGPLLTLLDSMNLASGLTSSEGSSKGTLPASSGHAEGFL